MSKIQEVERLAVTEIYDMLEEIRQNTLSMGRAQAMESLFSVNMMMNALKPEAMAVMFTIVCFQLAEKE